MTKHETDQEVPEVATHATTVGSAVQKFRMRHGAELRSPSVERVDYTRGQNVTAAMNKIAKLRLSFETRFYYWNGAVRLS